MRPGEGAGGGDVAAELVFQPGRGVTEQTARVAEVLRKNALSVAGLAMIESENP
jgi:hypothetical protein